MPRFTKIKLGKNAVTLAWTHDGEQHSMTSDGEPSPNFAAAMGAFSALLLTKCEQKGEVSAHTVSVSYHEITGNRTVVVSGNRKVQAGEFSLSTPSLAEPADGSVGVKPRNINPDWLQKLEDLCSQAQLYLEGERSQTDAFGSRRATSAIAADARQGELLGEAGGTEEQDQHEETDPQAQGETSAAPAEAAPDAQAVEAPPAATPPVRGSPVIDDVEGKQLEAHRKLAKTNIQNSSALTVNVRKRLIEYLQTDAPGDWVRTWSKTGVPLGKRPEVPLGWDGPAPAAAPTTSAVAAPEGTRLDESHKARFTSGGWTLAVEKKVTVEELGSHKPSATGDRFAKTDVEVIVGNRA